MSTTPPATPPPTAPATQARGWKHQILPVLGVFFTVIGLYMARDANAISRHSNNQSADAVSAVEQAQTAAGKDAESKRRSDVIGIWTGDIQSRIDACGTTDGPFSPEAKTELARARNLMFDQMLDGTFGKQQQDEYINDVSAALPEACRSGIDAIARPNALTPTTTEPSVPTTTPLTTPSTSAPSTSSTTIGSAPVPTTNGTPITINPDQTWGLQVGADTSLESAEFEAQQPTAGYAARIYVFDSSPGIWRTVLLGFTSESDARSAKDDVSRRWPSAFPVDLAAKCPNPVDKGAYIDCTTPS